MSPTPNPFEFIRKIEEMNEILVEKLDAIIDRLDILINKTDLYGDGR